MSKEYLEALERIRQDINAHNDCRNDFEDLIIIENYILKAQEQEKVIKAIFKKEFNFELFKGVLLSVGGRFEYKEYEKVYEKYGKEKLTEEEFNTLKEYFR